MCVEVVDDVRLILEALRLFQALKQLLHVDLRPSFKGVPVHDGSVGGGVVRRVGRFKMRVIHCPQVQKVLWLCGQRSTKSRQVYARMEQGGQYSRQHHVAALTLTQGQ